MPLSFGYGEAFYSSIELSSTQPRFSAPNPSKKQVINTCTNFTGFSNRSVWPNGKKKSLLLRNSEAPLTIFLLKRGLASFGTLIEWITSHEILRRRPWAIDLSIGWEIWSDPRDWEQAYVAVEDRVGNARPRNRMDCPNGFASLSPLFTMRVRDEATAAFHSQSQWIFRSGFLLQSLLSKKK